MAFAADIPADQQRRNLLHTTRILQLAAIDGAYSSNLCRKFARELCGIRIVAANDDIAVEWVVTVEEFCGDIVKGRDHAHAFRHKLCSLLRGRSLPNADRSRAPSAYCPTNHDVATNHNAS